MNIQEAMELLTEANVRTKDGHLISVNDRRIEISQDGLRVIGKELDKVFKKILEPVRGPLTARGDEFIPAIRVDIQMDRTTKGKAANRRRGAA